ncbi:FtsK/SpoIIIE family DNA translocase [Paenibacillus harenae]|uniref:S-DNA-T family DNA segregation ATPase FtsK/SpoIIIE n=1 Tax=Paenibacillus harenae TaxID=306543 RepID=A0ABT9U2B0_PAEHA|nr:DNA translocase FtsK [Paenibacillus harenae]MDQ0113138.1 S-DNA-T family DNA segregation ATPase FtsK/SpoIIIE [Paenibacillus harenae]
MAKRRKRKKSIAAQLKYEVYGILLITISIIALSGEATVGRSLSKLFGLVLGKFYFVLALIGVYVGLYVMVKRIWPKGWSNRKTGLFILVLALTLWSSITEIDKKLRPTTELSGSIILTQLSTDIRMGLLSTPTSDPELTEPDPSIRDKAISGGYVGALQYSMLFSLFGYYGTVLILLVMFAISLMLMTGKSYVELGRIIKKRTGNMIKLLMAKWAKRSSLRAAAANGPVAADGDDVQIIDDVDEYADYEIIKPKKKKSLFFSWRQDHAQDTPADKDEPSDEWIFEPSNDAGQTGGRPSWQTDLDQPWEKSGEVGDKAEPEEESPPWERGETIIHEAPAQTEPVQNDAWRTQTAEEPMPWQQQTVSDDYPSDGNDTDGIPLIDVDAVNDSSDLDADIGPGETSEALVISAGGDEHAPRRPIAEERPVEKPYLLPPFSLLTKPSLMGKGTDATDKYDSKRKLEATLESFGVKATVLDVVRGPAVTRYEVQPATGVKVSRIVSLTDDIALALAAKDIRMEAPIPGKSAIGIEVPNMEVSVVTMREVMETVPFQNATSRLSIAFGRDISGQPIIGNLAKMPHLLVAGATGSGKSVCINGIITSILYKATPDEVKFLMIDPKMVELNVYNGIPHLLAPVVTDPRRASLALKKIVVEMEKRYELFSKSATRNIEGYNTSMADNPAAVLPYIVVIVDELADLMMVAANDVEDSIARLAQMARAAGIHLIIATQRPSVDVITGVIKANIPSRIAFGVSSQVDSRTILDMVGAEKLLGRGDMLFLPVGMSKPIRVQGAFLSDQEVEVLVNYARGQAEAEYKEDLVPEIEDDSSSNEMQLDELYDQAVQIVLEAKQASVSLLQRRMRIGYTRAARLIDQMEAKSIVGPYEGSKPREVLMTMEQFQAGKTGS